MGKRVDYCLLGMAMVDELWVTFLILAFLLTTLLGRPRKGNPVEELTDLTVQPHQSLLTTHALLNFLSFV